MARSLVVPKWLGTALPKLCVVFSTDAAAANMCCVLDMARAERNAVVSAEAWRLRSKQVV